MPTTALVADGVVQPSLAQRIKTFDSIVAIDGGLLHCHRMDIVPDRIIGDFDSCPGDLLNSYSRIPRITLPKDKDLTDLEAALEQETPRASSLSIFGGWGKRIDHSLANAIILTRYPGLVRMETEDEIVFALEKESTLHCKRNQTLSLIPLNGPVTGLTTHGLKWELNDSRLDRHFIGISNICLEEVIRIQFQSGSLLVCILAHHSV